MEGNRRSTFVLLVTAGLVLLLPALASADGGPILTDPELWAMIGEGQQIAVVQLQPDGTAQVDLFISLTDRSGQSHEITFFLPLGIEAGDFEVVEETSLAFDEALTETIDKQFTAASSREDDFRRRVLAALLLGTLTTHASWLSPPALLPLIGFGWGIGAAPPLATFETPSSQVSVYEINSETDLQALIETTGLDPKVKETLAALQGQQIAVIKLQTQPVSAEAESEYGWESTGQPGIHLGWRSTLVPHAEGATYTYPLGTGQAWASPIEMTRVYVVSPPELDFVVEYPQLGDDLSDLVNATHYNYTMVWEIEEAESPVFAVTEAYGEPGHIWRAIYVKSNSAQDVVVTTLPELSQEMQQSIRHARVQGVLGGLTWLLAPLAGLALWITSWRVVMPRRLGIPYRWREGKLYRDALTWAGWYVITIVIALLPAGLVVFLGALLWPLYLLWAVAIPLAIAATLGLASAYLYARWETEKLQVTRGRAFGTYMLAVLLANVLYLGFAVAYYAIVCAI